MDYKISELETFLVVMELGTAMEAAARLNVSRSLVSSRISELERRMGRKLFHRVAGGLRPTREAELLSATMRPALIRLTGILKSLAEKTPPPSGFSGTLRISAPISLAGISLDHIAACFAEMHQEINILIEYDESHRNSLQDDFDIGLMIGQVHDTTLTHRIAWNDQLIACASPLYLQAHGVPYHPAELSDHSCIGYTHIANEHYWRFTRGDSVFSPVAHTRLTANNTESMRNLSHAGLGISLLPGFVAEPAIAADQLVPLLTNWSTRETPIVATWRHTRPERPEIPTFVDLLEQFISSQSSMIKKLIEIQPT